MKLTGILKDKVPKAATMEEKKSIFKRSLGIMLVLLLVFSCINAPLLSGVSAEAATKSIKNCKFSVSQAFVEYTGKALKPSVKVKYGSKTLKKGTDYTVSYSNNKKVGDAAIVIKGKGSYSGSVKKKFSIIPAIGEDVIELEPGLTYKLSVKSSSSVKYASDDKSVIKISSKGVITAVSEGIATITVTSNGKSNTVVVHSFYEDWDDDWDDDEWDDWDDDDCYDDVTDDWNDDDWDMNGDGYGTGYYDGSSSGDKSTGSGSTSKSNTAEDGAYILCSIADVNSGYRLKKEDQLKNFNISYYTYPLSNPAVNVSDLISSLKTELKKYDFEYAATYQLSSSYTKYFFTYTGNKSISPAGCYNADNGRYYDMVIEYFVFTNQDDGLQFSYPKEFVSGDAADLRRAPSNNSGSGSTGGGSGSSGSGSGSVYLGIDCPSCIDGMALCWKCSNVNPTHVKCDKCHGSGYTYSGLKQVTCSKCYGYKFTACSVCGGRGRLVCTVCGGLGTW